MELHLQRTYHPAGTNGVLRLGEDIICYTIELPWRNNERGLSCIPEGRYRLETRYSPLLRNHLQVEHVPDRTSILFHPANNALKELKGCIAPVSRLVGPGRGVESRLSFNVFRDMVYGTIRAGENVWLIISKDSVTGK